MTLKMKLTGAAAALMMVAGVPMVVHAQGNSQGYAQGSEAYDGYCYGRKDDAKTTGTVVGAIAGGLLGSQISKNERGLGTVGGAVIGGVIGRNVGANSVNCLNGEYYAYQSGYYDPAPAPDGYDVVYYKARPESSHYTTVYYDRERHTSPGYAYNGQPSYNQPGYNQPAYGQPGYSQPAYGQQGDDRPSNAVQGWRDDAGTWRSGRPVAIGWKDANGRWHKGQVVAYGWKDRSGRWHESQQPSSGYGSNNGNSGSGASDGPHPYRPNGY